MRISCRTHGWNFHIVLFLLPILLLAACNQVPEMPRQMRQAVAGDWKQTDGPASLHFYADATVMVRLSGRNPPLSFRASYGLMKNGHISIETGDVWRGPIICTWEKGSKVMQVTIPEKKEVVLQFTKQ